MKVKSWLVLAKIVSLLGSLLLMGGCPTFDGFRLDVEHAIGRMSSERGQTPSEVCEPIYRREGASPLYKQCLTRQITADLSREEKYNLRFVKAFPSCVPLFRAHDISAESFDRYGECQVNAFVSDEQSRLVKWREGLRRRNDRVRAVSVMRKK